MVLKTKRIFDLQSSLKKDMVVSWRFQENLLTSTKCNYGHARFGSGRNEEEINFTKERKLEGLVTCVLNSCQR